MISGRFLALIHRPPNPGLALALAATLIISCFATPTPAQDLVQDNVTGLQRLVARSRLFPVVGPGLEELRRDTTGNYLVLAQPGKFISVYAADGRPLGDIPAGDSKHSALVSATDFDTGAQGRLYVADRGAKAVKIFDPQGKLVLVIPVASPVSIAALPDGGFGLTNLESRHLLDVYSSDGKLLREMGDFSAMAEHEKLNRLLNLGRLAADAKGNPYFAFTYFPEPTLRKYDRGGQQAYEVSLNTLEFEPAAQSIRRLIRVQDQRERAPSLNPIINAVGVDPRSERVWLAMGNILVEFDSDGSRMATYQSYTPDGDGLAPVAILVEPTRLLLAVDPAGIYEFARPDLKDVKPAQPPAQPTGAPLASHQGQISNHGADQGANQTPAGASERAPVSP
jgi:hypothetical protein